MSPILYNLSSNVINPAFTGLITTPMSPEFVFEDFRTTPYTVISIDSHIRFGDTLEYDIIDCRRDGYNLSSIDYSKIDCEDLSMVYSFFGVYCDEESDITFSIESIARQRLWINGSLAALCCTEKEIGRDLFTFRLAKGMNSFCIEQHESLKFFITTVRITSFEYEHKNGRQSLTDGNFHYKKGDFAVTFKENELYNGENFKFVCTPIDSVNLNLSLPLSFVAKESMTGKELYRRECRFFEFTEITWLMYLLISSLEIVKWRFIFLNFIEKTSVSLFLPQLYEGFFISANVRFIYCYLFVDQEAMPLYMTEPV